jgi:hypothetical protein
LLSWRVALLPYLDQVDLYRQFKLDEAWDSQHNKQLLAKMPTVFAPARGTPKEPHSTFCQVFVGTGAAVFQGKEGQRLQDIAKGTSATAMLAEAADAVPWTKPADLPYDDDKPLPKLGSHFPDGLYMLFADSSVWFIRKDYDEGILRKVISQNGDFADRGDLDKLKP